MLQLSVVDEVGVPSAISTVMLSIQAVNDPPILSFVTNQTLRDGPIVLNGQTGEASINSCMVSLVSYRKFSCCGALR